MKTIDKIRELLQLSSLRKFYAEATLEDGRKVATEAEAMAVGVELFVIGEDGAAEPVPDGTYTLNDGTTVVVAEGRIAQLGDEQAEEQEVEVEMEADPLMEELKAIGLEDDLAGKVMELVKKYAGMEDKKEEMSEAVVELAQQTALGLQTLSARLAKLEDAPGATGVEHTPAPAKPKAAAQEYAFGWEKALENITNFK